MLTAGDLEDAIHAPAVKEAVARGDATAAVAAVVAVTGPRIQAAERERCASFFEALANDDGALSALLRRSAAVLRKMPPGGE